MLGVRAVALLAVVVVVMGAGSTQRRSAACALAWRSVPSPSVYVGVLGDVFAASARDAWAVGGHQGGRGSALVEHWDGSRWAVVRLRRNGSLDAVSGSSARDVWAVGASGSPELGRPLVLHYDGRAWTSVPVALPPGRRGAFADVVALAPDDVWAVGQSTAPAPSADVRGLVAHWDGHAWAVELVGTAPLVALAAARPSDVWAVGPAHRLGTAPGLRSVVWHWDGRAWEADAPAGPAVDLYGATALTSGAVWAVGSTCCRSRHQLVAAWNGRTWRRSRLAVPDWLTDVAAVTPHDAWAVGVGAIVRWNGRRWTRSRRVAGDLFGVAARAPGDVWAVGAGRRSPKILHRACR